MSKKPSGRSSADRVPDRPEARARGNDLHNDAHHTLALGAMSADLRAKRDAKALRYMEIHAPDLIEVLGLGRPAPKAMKTIDVACPSCEQPAGSRCKSKEGNPMSFHQSRIRISKQVVEVELLIDSILKEA